MAIHDNLNSKTVELVASGSATKEGNISINLTNVKDYKNLSIDDFIIEFSRIQLKWTNAFTQNTGVGLSISKSYNASTGVLTLSGTGTNTVGNNTNFGFVNANWTTHYKVYRVY